jgi:Ca-activated chloride channel family protein
MQTVGDPLLLARSSLLPHPRRRFTGYLLILLVLSSTILALARPQFGRSRAALARTGRDVLVLLDLSRSMKARDVRPSRLEAAKRATLAIVGVSPGDRVGLIVFGGSAFLQLPLTTDRAAFEQFLNAANPGDVGDPSTNLPSALRTAATVFQHEGGLEFRVAVVLSDGESSQGDFAKAIDLLRQNRVRMFAMGIGTPEGASIPDSTLGGAVDYHRDHIGRVVVSRLDESGLSRVARETGGEYVRWGDETAARRIGLEIARLATREISAREQTTLADRFQWPLAVAIVTLFAASTLAEVPKP